MFDKLKDQRLIFAIIVLMIIAQTILAFYGHQQINTSVLAVAAQTAADCQHVAPALFLPQNP